MEQRALLSVSGSPLFALSAAAPADTTDLGYVDYREISAGDHTYQLTTRHAGVLTAELEAAGGNVELYDANYDPLTSGSPRVDWHVSENETYFRHAVRRHGGTDLWLAKPGRRLDLNLLVRGTAGDDVYNFDWTASTYQLAVNKVQYVFAPATIASLTLDAGSGWDRLELRTGEGNDNAVLRPGRLD